MPNVYKIWNQDRSIKKTVLATNLGEIVEKGKQKLGYSAGEPVTVVLDWDGTEVQDDAYFQTLHSNTRFVLLKPGETWTADRSYVRPSTTLDQTDSHGVKLDSPGGVSELLEILRRDITQLITLKPLELQMVVGLDQTTLAQSLNVPTSEAGRIQEKCQRFLDELQDTQEARELLHIISDSLTHSDSLDGSSKQCSGGSSGMSPGGIREADGTVENRRPVKRLRTEDT